MPVRNLKTLAKPQLQISLPMAIHLYSLTLNFKHNAADFYACQFWGRVLQRSTKDDCQPMGTQDHASCPRHIVSGAWRLIDSSMTSYGYYEHSSLGDRRNLSQIANQLLSMYYMYR